VSTRCNIVLESGLMCIRRSGHGAPPYCGDGHAGDPDMASRYDAYELFLQEERAEMARGVLFVSTFAPNVIDHHRATHRAIGHLKWGTLESFLGDIARDETDRALRCET